MSFKEYMEVKVENVWILLLGFFLMAVGVVYISYNFMESALVMIVGFILIVIVLIDYSKVRQELRKKNGKGTQRKYR